MEVNAYEDETIDYEGGTVDTRKGCVELVASTDVNVNPANACADSDEDDDGGYDGGGGEINYFDDDLSE